MIYTRFLENWVRLNPTLKHHSITNINVTFRTFCLHASFRHKFMRALNSGTSMPAALSETVLSHVDHDFDVCLDVLRRYAVKADFLNNLYNLAIKIAAAAVIDEKDLERATLKAVELVGEAPVVPGEHSWPAMQGFMAIYSNLASG